jgi:hypothetical protein
MSLSAEDVLRLAHEKKCVTHKNIGRTPAAFLISMPFYLVMRYVRDGLTEYVSKEDRKK